MDSSNPLILHISLEKLKCLIREEKNKHVFPRLLFIHQLYLEDGVEKACKRMCISKQIGYNWLNQWNEQGYESINPNFGGGRPPKLTKKQKEQLKEKLKSKGAWLTPEVRALIRNVFSHYTPYLSTTADDLNYTVITSMSQEYKSVSIFYF